MFYVGLPSATAETVKVSKFQLELGTVATTYQAFVPNSPSPDYPSPILSTGDTGILNVTSSNGTVTNNYPITLPVGYVGGSLQNGVKDDDEFKRKARYIFNGTESWDSISTASTNTIRVQLYVSTMKNIGGIVGTGLYADKFKVGSYFSTDAEGIQQTNDVLYLRVLKSRLGTVDLAGFKTWLASNNVTVHYELATPIDVSSSIALPQVTTYQDYTQVTSTNTVKANLSLRYKSLLPIQSIDKNTYTDLSKK